MIAYVILGVLAGAVAVLAAMLAFGTSAAPPPLASISAPFETVDYSDLPVITMMPVSSGGTIGYRVYPAQQDPQDHAVVIAVHGSSASSASLHPLAKALQAAGHTVYVPDIRGHGVSGRHGDIDRPGQLDDDLTALARRVRDNHPRAPLALLGFSSGGGFALRIAATPLGDAFARVVLIAPMLGYDAPTMRPGKNAWVSAFVPRIIAIGLLNRLGIHAFDRLPVLAFAIAPDNSANLTRTYSFRLMRAFSTTDYQDDLRKARAPLAVVVGGEDQLFIAERFAPTIHALRPDVQVTVVPDLGHIAMTTDARAIPAIVAALRVEP